jgi:ABC-2 type transport system ATP-binding protein
MQARRGEVTRDSTMLAIETTNLTKDYAVGFWRKHPRRVLHSLNLQVEKEEVFGLLGPNGAGKSTTLKILLRLIFPTEGTARILGHPFEDVRNHSQIGFLPENPYFYDHLSPAEFLNYSGALFGLSGKDLRKRSASLLERVGLGEVRDMPLRKFSKGMVQRLGIAQALINDPELIILDEPMSGLDPIGRREVRDLILDLRRQGKTILFSTHILSDAESLCDRVAILNRGRLQGSGGLREMLGMETAATEIVVDNPSPQVLSEVTTDGRSLIRTGERVRIVLRQEESVAVVLECLLRHRVKIISVNPVKTSLEDYFLSHLTESNEPATSGESNLDSEGREKGR